MAEKNRAQTLQIAAFNPRIKTYLYIGGIFICILSVVGIIVLPFWLILGKSYMNKYFDSLHCELTTHALKFSKGVWFQVERTIPLDKIQDLTFHEGPLLKKYNLSTLKIETAGNSSNGMSDMSLTGIVDARNFREQVLDQRDEFTNRNSSSTAPKSSPENEQQELIALLNSMHKTLQEIEKKVG